MGAARPAPSHTLCVLTRSLAGLGEGIELEALLTLALEAALKVHAELAAGVRVLTLVDICALGQRKRFGTSSPQAMGRAMGSDPKPCPTCLVT